MRSIAPGARACLVAFLAVGLMNLPAMAASEQPLGMIVSAEHARLDNANAVSGTNLFSGDTLATDQGGSLRLKIGPGQIYLLSSSSAVLAPDENGVRAKVDRGTLGFSTPAPGQLAIETPLGVVRGADGKPIFGQVSILSLGKMRVSSYEGTLVVEGINGQEKMIAAGETYDATLVPNAQTGNNPPPKGVTGAGINWAHVAVVGGILVAAGVLACSLWPESDSTMGCW